MSEYHVEEKKSRNRKHVRRQYVMRVNGETTHVGPDWCLWICCSERVPSGQRSPPAICAYKSPPRRGCADQSEDGSNKQRCYIKNRGEQKGSVPDVILHSLYEEHAVRWILFLWCRAAPVSGIDLKDLQELMSAGHVNTKLHDWRQARNMRDWEHS